MIGLSVTMRLACAFVCTSHLSCSLALQSQCSFELVQELGTLFYADFLNVHQFPLDRRKFLNAFDAHHTPIRLPCFQLSAATMTSYPGAKINSRTNCDRSGEKLCRGSLEELGAEPGKTLNAF